MFFATTGSFPEGIVSDGLRYSEIMADTNLSRTPRLIGRDISIVRSVAVRLRCYL